MAQIITGRSFPAWVTILSVVLFASLGVFAAASSISVILAFVLLLVIATTFWQFQRTLVPLYLLIFTSLLIAYRLPLSFVNVTPYRAMILLACAYAIANVLAKRNEVSVENAFQRVWLGALFLLPVSLIYTINVIRSLSHPQAVFKFLSFGVAVVTIVVFTYYASDRRQYLGIVKAQFISATLLAAYGIYEVVAQIVTGNRPNLPLARFGFETVIDKRFGSFEASLGLLRAESLLNDSNILAVYLSSALIFGLSLMIEQNGSKSRTPYVGSLFIIAICLIFTLSRSAMLGFLAAGFFILFKRMGKGRRFGFKALFTVFIVILALLALTYLSVPAMQTYVQGLLSRFSTINFESRRLMLLTNGALVFFDNLVFGTGVGALESHGVGSHTTHSSYLTMLAETGIIGGLALSIFLLPILWAIWEIARDPRARILDLCIVAGTISLLVFELFYDTLFVSPTSMILVAIGYSYSIWKLNHGRDGGLGTSPNGAQSTKTV